MQRETLRPPEGSVTDSEPCLLEIPHSLCPVPEAGVPRGQGSRRSCGPPVSWVAPCRQNACVSISVLPSPGLPRPSCSLTLHPHIAPRYPGGSSHVVSKYTAHSALWLRGSEKCPLRARSLPSEWHQAAHTRPPQLAELSPPSARPSPGHQPGSCDLELGVATET